ncbi:MAG: tetratricopeptide repeat protein [Candidatus Eremiobacteraeota bacterium]|nr:tetratricopeptide repeat protein [Candidatus Eremiobacteraeota bacterium]
MTFLFTDIEGSTERWESHRDAMADAVKRHDVLVRNAIESHGGYVFKTVGDAFCATFPRVSDAVAAALHAQRALVQEDFSQVGGLRVRLALHTGEASERDGDYFGPTVNRAARLLAVGSGGQMLLSGVTAHLAQPALRSQTSLSDLGTHRLKDLAQPEHIYQLCVPDLACDFPPLRSLEAHRHNFPVQLTSLRGRERDVEDVRSLLDGTALLTLVGAGGIGKTRLALQVGAELIDRYPDGVWFVELASLSDPELVVNIAAQVLNVAVPQNRSPIEAIVSALRRKRMLVILDNCEHLVAAAANLANAILTSCPDVRILATSRQGLGISGEIVHQVPPLAVPEKTQTLKLDEALRYGAVVLFADRAAAADTKFALSDDTAPIVAEICRHLDGIALAIELAAARVKVLSIPHLAERLAERFRLLTGGSRAALPRQQTLRALIDWSYDLLAESEKMLFRRVSIFAGGWTADTASAVCSGDNIDNGDVLELLASLAEKSLAVVDTTGPVERYRLLESTRAYGLELLTEKGERTGLASRHAECFAAVAREADEASKNLPAQPWLKRYEPEIDNFRAALNWAITADNDPISGGTIAGNLGLLWWYGGRTEEGRRWTATALRGIDETAAPAVAARLWLTSAVLNEGQGKLEAGERARMLYESVGDRRGAARALRCVGSALHHLARMDEAEVALRKALTDLREAGDAAEVVRCLFSLSSTMWARGDIPTARQLLGETLAAAKALGDEAASAAYLFNLAELEFSQGGTEAAVRYASDALAIYVEVKNFRLVAIVQANLSIYRIALGQLSEARAEACEAIRWARETQYSYCMAIAIQHLALLLSFRSERHRAARLTGYVDAAYQKLGNRRESTEEWGYQKLLSSLREGIASDELGVLMAEGAGWTEEQAVEEALKI